MQHFQTISRERRKWRDMVNLHTGRHDPCSLRCLYTQLQATTNVAARGFTCYRNKLWFTVPKSVKPSISVQDKLTSEFDGDSNKGRIKKNRYFAGRQNQERFEETV